MKEQRIVYFDYLRILAVFAVVVLHTSSGSWNRTDVNSSAWLVFNFYDGIARWCVPVFVMISGALFLGRKLTIKKLYAKYILRIAVAFVFWSTLYAVWNSIVMSKSPSVTACIRNAVVGHYHLWFLYMIAGLYMVVPFLNAIVSDRKTALYFVIGSFVFASFLPQLAAVAGFLSPGLSAEIKKLVSKLMLHLVLGYSGYFVLGYLLHYTPIHKKCETAIYVLGVLGLVVTVAATALLSRRTQAKTEAFFSYLTVNVFFTSAAVFVFAKNHLNRPVSSVNNQNLLAFLSKCSFGVYLIHPFFLQFLTQERFAFHPLLSVPIRAIIVFFISLLISGLLNKIPVVKDWLV